MEKWEDKLLTLRSYFDLRIRALGQWFRMNIDEKSKITAKAMMTAFEEANERIDEMLLK